MPETNPSLSGDVLQSLEQFESLMRDFAPVLATYRKALLDAGVPRALADRLVVEFQNTFWMNAKNQGNGRELK